MPYTLVAPPPAPQDAPPPQSGGRYRLVEPPPSSGPIHRGNILPIDRDAEGGLHFNSDSGVLGAVKRAFSLPGEVYSGDVPTMVPDTGQGVTAPELVGRSNEAAALLTPINPAVRAGDLAIPAAREVLTKRWEPAPVARGTEMPAGGAAPMEMNEVISKTYEPLRNVRPTPVPAPTREELHDAASGGYKRASGMGVDYRADAIADLAFTATATLEGAGFMPITAPVTFRILKRLSTPPSDSVVQLMGLETARKALRKIPTSPDSAADREAARRVIAELDRFSENPPASDVLAGPAAAAGAIQKDARGNWAAMERSKEVSGRQASAERRARASNSGKNIDNTLRQRVATLLDQIEKGKMPGYSRDEIAAMNEFVDGKITRNSTRFISNLLGGGGGLGSVVTGMAGVGAGGYTMGPWGAIAGAGAPALGWGMKSAQNALGRRAMGKIDEQVRARSPLARERAAAAPEMPAPTTSRSALARSALVAGTGSFDEPYQMSGDDGAQRAQFANVPVGAFYVNPEDGRTYRKAKGNPAPTGAEESPQGPNVGDIQDGYRFKGGDPASPQSWQPVA